MQRAPNWEGSRRCSGHLEVICADARVQHIDRVRVMVCYLFRFFVFFLVSWQIHHVNLYVVASMHLESFAIMSDMD
jgi:hypothetical protein